jgi:hypothetical protein
VGKVRALRGLKPYCSKMLPALRCPSGNRCVKREAGVEIISS